MVLLGSRGDDGGATITGPSTGGVADEAPIAGDPVGPQEGESVERYVQARRAALDSVEGRQIAVVSLTGYASVETVADLIDDLELDRHLIALVGDEARATRSVDETIDEVVSDAEAQLAEIEQIAPTVEDDPEFSQFYADEIERYRRLIASAGEGGIVYGMVVEGSAADLRALASRASVRLVDVVPAGAERDASLLGLRPEEATTVGTPTFRP